MPPQQLYCYGDKDSDIFDWAASYCSHLAKNHAFTDGNKRTAFASAVTFLEVNGIEFPRRSELEEGLAFPDEFIAQTVELHITGQISEKRIAEMLYLSVARAFFVRGEDGGKKRVANAQRPQGSVEENQAYLADLFLTSITLELIDLCEKHFINPQRLYEAHQAGTDGVATELHPHFQRVFGLIPSKQTPTPE